MYIVIIEYKSSYIDMYGNLLNTSYIINEENIEDCINILKNMIEETYEEELTYHYDLGIEKITLFKVEKAMQVNIENLLEGKGSIKH